MSTSVQLPTNSGTWRILVGIPLVLLFGLPLLYGVLSAFKSPLEAASPNQGFLPRQWSLENFTSLSSGGVPLASFIGNSIAVTSLTMLFTVVVAVPAGYAFSRLRFPFRRAFFALTIAVLLVPSQAIVVGIFSVMSFLRLTNRFVGLALVYSMTQLPFAVYMMRNSFDSIPAEIAEAAEIDGCTKLTVLWQVYLRLVPPGIVTIALFAFIAAWNEFFMALILLSNNADFTLPVALVNAQTGVLNTIDWGSLQAGIATAILPSVILFTLLQRYYVAGLISGAVK